MGKPISSCKILVRKEFEEIMTDIRTLWEAENQETPELGHLHDYGLCIDVVEPGTFKNQRERYKRYQIGWGGPAQEFRVYENGDVEFWYLNWFDGASVNVYGSDARIIKEICEVVEW